LSAIPKQDLTSVEVLQSIVRYCYHDPELFVRRVLKAEPTAQQREGLREIAKDGAKVSIRSGHGVGKTGLLAWAAAWFLITRWDCKIPCTAPTAGQLRDVLWPELYKWREEMPDEFRHEMIIQSDKFFIKSAPQMQFGVLRTSRKDQPDSLQGFSARNLLYIIDEAPGVPDAIFDVARAGLSRPGARILMAGNPIKTSGFFYDSHHKFRTRWTPLHWSCLDSPLPAPDYAKDMATDYGEDSNFYRVRVLGDFPKSEADQFIELDLVEDAVVREDVVADGPIVWGLDPAYMGDCETVMASRQGDVFEPLQAVRGLDTMGTAGWVADMYDNAENKPVQIVVDMIGIGAGVYDRLRELKFPVVGCNVAESPSNGRYMNLRAELWGKYKGWLQQRRGKLPDDPRLMGQSCVIKYKFTSSGKLQMESKMDMRRRGVASPDRADAVCLTFYQTPIAGSARTKKTEAELQSLIEQYSPVY